MLNLTIDGFQFTTLQAEGVKEFIFETSRLDACIEYCNANNIKRVRLHPGKCYSVDFLGRCPQIEYVVVQRQYGDIRGLYELPNLRQLILPENPADFNKIPSLHDLTTKWDPKSGPSIYSLSKLCNLRLRSYKKGLISDMPKTLQELEFIQPSFENLEGIQMLPQLKKLSLYSCPRLTTIGALLKTEIVHLDIEKCRKIVDLLIVREIKSLRILGLTDLPNIDSLAFINELPNLEGFGLVGMSVKDGDLTPCLRLKGVGIYPHKRSYSHTPDQLTEEIAKHQSSMRR